MKNQRITNPYSKVPRMQNPMQQEHPHEQNSLLESHPKNPFLRHSKHTQEW